MSTINQPSASPQTVFTAPSSQSGQGTWMFYDQATAATGKSEKTLKRYVKKGDLKWRRMGRQVNSPIQVFITPDLVASFGNEAAEKVDDAEILEAESYSEDFSPEAHPAKEAPNGASDEPYERVIKLMVGEFTQQLDRQREVLFELKKELQEKEIQLRLIPDLQRKLEEKESDAELKTIALEKQIEAQAKLLDELQTEKETESKQLEDLKVEQAKLVEELRLENDKLRAEQPATVTAATPARSWWSWFLGQS